MSTTILLIRHGQTASNITGYYMGWSDEDINEIGQSQVCRLASRLAQHPITAIYTSPLKRAVSTANIITAPHKGAVTPMQDLIEINLGEWQGHKRSEVQHKWPELWPQYREDPSEITFPGGESFTQVTERAVRALNAIIKAHPKQQVAITTHEIIIKVIVAHILNTTNRIYRRFEIDNASLSIIQVDNNHSRLLLLNDVSHLCPDEEHSHTMKN